MHERRFYFESLKMNYSCLDSEEEFKNIFMSLINSNEIGSVFKDIRNELTTFTQRTTQLLGDIFSDKRALHSKILNFLSSLILSWKNIDSSEYRSSFLYWI